MPTTRAICLENLDDEREPRFLRCVALVGGQPGLQLDQTGALRWKEGRDDVVALCVSGDNRLVLLRKEVSPSARVSRAGRSVDAPCGKPVVLLHGDEIMVAGVRWKLHDHGETAEVHSPAPVPTQRRGRFRVAAAALAVTATLGAQAARGDDGGSAGTQPVADPSASALLEAVDAGEDEAAGDDAGVDAIEVRESPPVIAEPPPPPPGGCCAHTSQSSTTATRELTRVFKR